MISAITVHQSIRYIHLSNQSKKYQAQALSDNIMEAHAVGQFDFWAWPSVRFIKMYDY